MEKKRLRIWECPLVTQWEFQRAQRKCLRREVRGDEGGWPNQDAESTVDLRFWVMA